MVRSQGVLGSIQYSVFSRNPIILKFKQINAIKVFLRNKQTNKKKQKKKTKTKQNKTKKKNNNNKKKQIKTIKTTYGRKIRSLGLIETLHMKIM